MSNEQVSQSTMSLRDGLRLAKTMPALNKGSMTPPRSRKHSAERGVITLQDCVPPQIPPTPAKPTVPQLGILLEPMIDGGYIRPIGAIPKDKLDSRASSKSQKQLASFSSNQMFFSNFGKDGEAIATFKQLPLTAGFDPVEIQEFVDALYNSMGYIGSSGSLSGLLTRLRTGLCDSPKVRWPKKECVAWAQKVLKYKPVDVVFKGQGVTEVFEQVGDVVKINFLSNAGVPYYAKIGDGNVLSTAVEVAALFLECISQGRFNDVVVKGRPALLAVLLKNKQDYYPISRLEDKIRPYFVYGLHERLLYSCLQGKLKALRFDEDMSNPQACSAVGFSWNYGGGDRLYSWIVLKHEAEVGLYPLFYGDDQLWVLKTRIGTFIVTPDYSHMDMSLASDVGKVAYQMWRPAYSLDTSWDYLLKLNCSRAFERPVIVDGAQTYYFGHGLASGIPGTTKFDEVASAVVCGYLQEKFLAEESTFVDPGDVEHWLGDCAQKVKKKFGLIFKDGTLSLHKFIPGQDEYSWEFLGQSLVRLSSTKTVHYVPKPRLDRLMLSATTYKKIFKSPKLRIESTMYKMRSLYAGGGYHYKVFSDRAEAYFENQSKRRFVPISEGDEDFESESEGSNFFTIEFSGDDHSWPSWQWCANHFLPPDDQLPITAAIYGSDGGPSGEEHVQHGFSYDLDGFDTSEESESPDEGVHDEEGENSDSGETVRNLSRLGVSIPEGMDSRVKAAFNPRDWATQSALERPDSDIGGQLPIPPKEVGKNDTGRLLPLSDAQKRHFEEQRNAERAAERDRAAQKRAAFEASRAGSIMLRKRGQRIKPGARSGAQIHEGDFDYQDDDDELGHNEYFSD